MLAGAQYSISLSIDADDLLFVYPSSTAVVVMSVIIYPSSSVVDDTTSARRKKHRHGGGPIRTAPCVVVERVQWRNEAPKPFVLLLSALITSPTSSLPLTSPFAIFFLSGCTATPSRLVSWNLGCLALLVRSLVPNRFSSADAFQAISVRI